VTIGQYGIISENIFVLKNVSEKVYMVEKDHSFPCEIFHTFIRDLEVVGVGPLNFVPQNGFVDNVMCCASRCSMVALVALLLFIRAQKLIPSDTIDMPIGHQPGFSYHIATSFIVGLFVHFES
jgi:hypothetical protein